MNDQFVILSVCRIVVKTNCKYVLSMVKYFLVMPYLTYILGFPGGSDGQESACSAGDPGSTPGLGRLRTALLRYNSRIIQSIHLKYTVP